MASAPSSNTPSRTSTPAPTHNSRFTPQSSTAEDLLKSQTVGLIHLSDYRKRRAEAIEQKEREAHDRSYGRFSTANTSGEATPSDGASTPQTAFKKQKKKAAAKGKLSFGVDGEEEESEHKGQNGTKTPSKSTPNASSTPARDSSRSSSVVPDSTSASSQRLGPNQSLSYTPKVRTKAALVRDAQMREQLRKEFLAIQEAVQATEFLVPFVFYDGTNIPGGICKMKKGDYIWVFLDRSRKVGAELGVGGGGGGGGGEKGNSRREWARVGVDDLMLVRGEIIIPHHFTFYYFLREGISGPNSTPIFPYSNQPPPSLALSAQRPPSPRGPSAPRSESPEEATLTQSRKTASSKIKNTPLVLTEADKELEGYNDDPHLTKVVDRRWYERNKHIFPASVWEEFEPGKDYSKAMRRDGQGNAFFFS